MPIALPPSLTLENSAAALPGLLAQVAEQPGGQAVVDASALTEVDSAALAVLLACRRAADGAGRSWQVAHPPTHLSELAQLYGVGELLGLPEMA